VKPIDRPDTRVRRRDWSDRATVLAGFLFLAGAVLRGAGFAVHSKNFHTLGSVAFLVFALLAAVSFVAEGLKRSVPLLGGVSAAVCVGLGLFLATWGLPQLRGVHKLVGVAFVIALFLCAFGWRQVYRSQNRKR
jgi:hypothetical protein